MSATLPALYPLRTDPVYRHYIWGGNRLGPLLDKPPGPNGTLAESWEIADEARVAGGAWHGHTLREVDEATGGALTGDSPHYPNARLPILIKLSDSAQNLSVQIHPNDEQALSMEPDSGYPGKTEMYLVLAAEEGAGVYWGLREGVSPEQLEQACRTGWGVPDLLHFVPVKPGDVLYSPSGVVHAIGEGIVYCEVQQNSDITYRLFDWGRVDTDGKPRPLHLEKALAVLDVTKQKTKPIQPLTFPTERHGVTRTMLCACRYFAVELLEFFADESAPTSACAADTIQAEAQVAVGSGAGEVAHISRQPGTPHLASTADVLAEAGVAAEFGLERSKHTMRAVVVLDGTVAVSAGPHVTHCSKGHSVAIPAGLPESAVGANGPARVLLAYEPDLAADVVGPLRGAGYTAEEVAQLGDFT